MDFSDRIRSYQAKAIYSDLANRATVLGSNCQLTSNCTSVGCKLNFQTYALRDQLRQGRADCTGNSNLLPVYLTPTLSNRGF